MAYLTSFDYKVRIQDAQLNQITSNDLAVKKECELLALDIFKSKLIQKYDVDAEFTDTTQYSNTLTYKANMLVYLDGIVWSNATVYTNNQIVVYTDSNVYLKNSTTAGYSAGILPTNATFFTLLGKQHDYYNTIVPKPFWDYETYYTVGTEIFYKDKIYTAIQNNISVAPDDINYGVSYWGSGVAYSVSAGQFSDTTKWQQGDNRNAQCVNYMIDVIVYEIMTRIPQRQIPQFRIDKYNWVVNNWLEDCARGETLTLAIPRLPFRSGSRIRVSQNTKNINSY